MNTQIVITGMGAVTCAGVGVDAYWDALLAGRCCIGPLELPGVDVPRAGVVRDFRPGDFLPKRLVLDMDVFMQYAYVSAEQALAQSGLDPAAAPDRVGVVMGTALAGLAYGGETRAAMALEGKKAGPKFLPKVMGNMACARFAIEHALKGPSLTLSTACASGGDAVLLGGLLLRAGAADAMVVMAGESALCPPVMQSLAKTGALSKTGQSRPFDENRDGFVAGEGGGALILETAEHARARGAKPLARLLGCANNTDAYNPVAPDPSGAGAARCMALALERAGLSAADVDYINAHGTATPMGDVAEAKAVHAVFADRPVPVSSVKGCVGHLMGAGGVTELIACVKAVQTGLIPPTVGCESVDGACGLNVVRGAPLRAEVRAAMSNALGFGGQNSSVIVGRAGG